MSTKELPERRNRGAHESGPAPLAGLDRPVPVLALPRFTLLPGTLVPLQAFEPEPCRTLAYCLADRRLLVIAAIDEPGPERALHRVAGVGRIVSDRRHPDGRVDAFVHGLARVMLGDVSLGPDGLSAPVELLPDVAHASTSEAGLRLFAVASALRRVLADGRADGAAGAEALSSLLAGRGDGACLEDLALMTYRLAATFIDDFAERQSLLEERCPATRCDDLAARLGELLLAASRPPRGLVH